MAQDEKLFLDIIKRMVGKKIQKNMPECCLLNLQDKISVRNILLP